LIFRGAKIGKSFLMKNIFLRITPIPLPQYFLYQIITDIYAQYNIELKLI